MLQPRYKTLRILALALSLLTLGLPGPAPAHQSAVTAGQVDSEPNTPLEVSAKLSHAPPLGQTATLTCTATAKLDAPNTSVEILLPAGVELVSGNLRWQGTLPQGNSTTISADLRFETAGDVAITCKAFRRVDADEAWGDTSSVYLSVGPSASRMGFAPGRVHNGSYRSGGEGAPVFPPGDSALLPTGPIQTREGSRLPSVNPQNPKQRAPSAPQAPTGTLTLTGRWAYYDRNDNYVGANQFLLEIVQANGTHIDWCFTDTGGHFSCSITNPGSAGVRTYIRSWVNYNPSGNVLGVFSQACGTDVSCSYLVQSGAYYFPDGTYNIGEWSIPNGDTYEGAFWIKDDLDRAWKYITFTVNAGEYPGQGLVYWSYDSTDGDYYSRGEQIHLNGYSSGSHDTAIHEYGHNVMWNIYGAWMPSSDCPIPHSPLLYSGTNCGWIEGWADFLPLVANGDPVYHWASGATMNFETPTWGTSFWDTGDGVEGRVAGALLDIYDSANDGYDGFANGFINIWDTIFHQTDNNFREYFDAWVSRGHAYGPASNCLYQNTINYRDPTNPSIAFISPSTGVWYKTNESVNWTITDSISGAWGYRDAVDAAPTGYSPDHLGSTGSMTFSTMGQGKHYILIQAWDNSGNYAAGSRGQFWYDSVAPTGSISVNGGAAFANSANVTLNLAATDLTSGVAQMRIGNGGMPWSAWEPYATSKAWSLVSGEGTRTVYVLFRDTAGNTSTWYGDSIAVDSTAPTASATSPASTRNLSFTVSWTGADAASGVASYDVQFRVGESGLWQTWLSTTTATSATFGPSIPLNVQRGQSYYLRARARDTAGNVGSYPASPDSRTDILFYILNLPLVGR